MGSGASRSTSRSATAGAPARAPDSIGMTVLPGNDRSVASVLLAPHEDIENPYEHPLLRFFTTAEARELRRVHPEFEVAVEATRFDDLETPVTDFRRWREANRSAISLRLSGHANLGDFVEFAATGALEGLEGRPGIQKLRVEAPYDVPAMYDAYLAVAVERIPSLQELHLPFAGLDQIEDLAEALPPTLTLLDMYQNRIGPAGAAALAAALPRLSRLTTLQLSSTRIGTEGVAALAPVLPATLRVLELAGCGMGDAGAAALGAALPGLPALTHLEISANGLTFAGLRALLPGLPETLQELLLDGNRFGPAGAREVAALLLRLRTLPMLPALQVLSLNGCHIGDEGVQVLAPSLRGHPELTELGLHYNDIGTVGVKALVPVLLTLPTLRKLGMAYNEGGEELRAAMVRALPSKTISLYRENGTQHEDAMIVITPRKRSSRRTNRRRSTRRRVRR
jgi:hypothetical protein